MKRDELKRTLKPLIKQCIKEVIFEDGVLSGIITEIVKGLGSRSLVAETTSEVAKPEDDSQHRQLLEEARQSHLRVLEEQRQTLSESISTHYNGVDLFEGVNPMRDGPSPGSGPTVPSSPLAGVAPDDPGVDISKLGILAKGR